MKRFLLLLAAGASLTALPALAQDKPVLNTTPPGPPAAPAQPATPTPAPTAPANAPVAAPAPDAPQAPVQPSAAAPSGLDFPNQKNTKAGGAEDEPPTRKFLYTNMGLGFSGDNVATQFNFSLSPAIGFRLTDKFALGPGLSYAYNNLSLTSQARAAQLALTRDGQTSLSTSSLGFKAFAQYIVYREFFIHGEYEVTNAQLIAVDNAGWYFKYKQTVTSPLGGIGYRSTLGQRAAMDIVGLYNFNSSVFSLYPGLSLRFSLLYNIGK